MIRRNLLLAAATAAPILIGSGIASATPYSVQVWESNYPSSAAQDATPSGVGALTGGTYISATFDWNGTLNFDLTTPQNSTNAGDHFYSFFGTNPGAPGGNPTSLFSNYQCATASCTLGPPSGADFTNLTTFLNSSGSASSFAYGALFKIDLGVLPANTLVGVTHDDGASLWQGTTQVGSLTSSPTVAITQYATVPGSTQDTYLYYGYENGSPEVLQVKYNGSDHNPALPEPTSMAVLATGLLGLGFLVRRRSLRG